MRGRKAISFALPALALLGAAGACGLEGATNAVDAPIAVGRSAPDDHVTTAPNNDLPPPSVDNDPRSRANDDGTPKIVGGTLVVPPNFADVVGITKAGSSGVRCTGTLIEPDIVLTAAHCVCDGIDGRVFVGNTTAGGGTFYNVRRRTQGLKFVNTPSGRACESGALKKSRDLAILLLDRPVVGVAPRALPTDANAIRQLDTLVDHATSFRAVGFGAIDRDASDYRGEKREARIPAASNSCLGTVPEYGSDEVAYGCQPGDEIVAGRMGGPTDTCNGDSGGPLFMSPHGTGSAASSAAYRLVGVTSRPTSYWNSPCGDGGIYERLNASGLAWVRRAIANVRAP